MDQIKLQHQNTFLLTSSGILSLNQAIGGNDSSGLSFFSSNLKTGSQESSMSEIDKSVLEQLKSTDSSELIKCILKLQQQLKKTKRKSKTLERNLKAVVYKESVQFLKDKSRVVTEVLTRNHRRLVTKFIDFRKATMSKTDEVEKIKDKLIEREKNLATVQPVVEAEYQIKRKEVIGFYDCLVPRLKIIKKPSLKDKEIGNNSAEIDYFGDLIVENDSLKAKQISLDLDLAFQKSKVQQLVNELELVQWYTEVLESGVVTKDLYLEMVKTKETNKELHGKIAKMASDHAAQLSKVKSKLKTTQQYLVKTNNEVVKPLMQEVKIVAELKERYKAQYEKNFEDLRILNAITRLPRMSDQLYKTIKKREQEEQFELRKQEAVCFMRQYVDKNTSDIFFNKFLKHLDKTIPEQSSNPIEQKLRIASSAADEEISRNQDTLQNFSQQQKPRLHQTENLASLALTTAKQISLNEKINSRRKQSHDQMPKADQELNKRRLSSGEKLLLESENLLNLNIKQWSCSEQVSPPHSKGRDINYVKIDEVTESNENQTPVESLAQDFIDSRNFQKPDYVTFDERKSLKQKLSRGSLKQDLITKHINIQINQTIPVSIQQSQSTSIRELPTKTNSLTPKKNSVFTPRKRNVTSHNMKTKQTEQSHLVLSGLTSPRHGKNLIKIPKQQVAFRTENISPVRRTTSGDLTAEWKASPTKVLKRQEMVSDIRTMQGDGISQIHTLVERQKKRPSQAHRKVVNERSKTKNTINR